jgi:hypothetical protein
MMALRHADATRTVRRATFVAATIVGLALTMLAWGAPLAGASTFNCESSHGKGITVCETASGNNETIDWGEGDNYSTKIGFLVAFWKYNGGTNYTLLNTYEATNTYTFNVCNRSYANRYDGHAETVTKYEGEKDNIAGTELAKTSC